MSIIDDLKRDAEGAALLRDWLGEGGHPVERPLAFDRATVCCACPLNTAPNWWGKFTNAIAMTIRKQLEIKNKMSLQLIMEESLSMCSACGCSARLKVWVPIEHIKSHTESDTMELFHSKCWIRKELQT